MLYDALSLEQKRRIDRVVKEFEDSRCDDSPPSLSFFLEQLASEDREVGLLELIALDYELRVQNQESPTLETYRRELPNEVKLVEVAFQNVVEELQSSERLSETEPWRLGELPEFLGDFRLVREIGRGGMGRVYEAVQESLHRRVALKVLPSSLWLPESGRARFQREARVIAKLHHEHIVQVFGNGDAAGVAYIAMQLVEGQSLDRILVNCRLLVELRSRSNNESAGRVRNTSVAGSQKQLPAASGSGSNDSSSITSRDAAPHDPSTIRDSNSFAESQTPKRTKGLDPAWCEIRTRSLLVARIGCEIGNALQYAHAAGVLHRDLKPSNILLDNSGSAWLTDFGLAKVVNTDTELTNAGDVIGTVRYMAPEVLHGRSDARSDVFSLGVTLLELLSLRAAYDEANRSLLIQQVLAGALPDLARLEPEAPRDLVTIITKACNREPAERFQTAGEFAADLQRFLNDEPIMARRASLLELFTRWRHHHRALSFALLVIGWLLVAGIGLTSAAALYFQNLEAGQRQLAAEKAELAERNGALAKSNGELAAAASAERDRATLLLADSFARQGLATTDSGRDREATMLFATAARTAHGVSADEYQRNVRRLMAINRHMLQFEASGSLWGHPPHRLRFHRESRAVLIRNRFGGQVNLFVIEGPDLKRVGWPSSLGPTFGAAWSPDGSRVFVSGRGGATSLRYPQLDDPQSIDVAFPNDRTVQHLEVDASGRWLALASDSELRVWDVKARRFASGAIPQVNAINDMAFSSNGEWLVCVDNNSNFRLYATKSLESPESIPQAACTGTHCSKPGVSLVAPVFLRRDTVLLTELEPGKVEVRELTAVDKPFVVNHRVGNVAVLEPIADEQVFVGGQGGFVLNLPPQRAPIVDHRSELQTSVMSAAYFHQRRELFVGYASRDAERWELPAWRKLPTPFIAGSGVHVAAGSPDESRLMTIGPAEISGRVWSMPSQARAPLPAALGTQDPMFASFSQDSTKLAVAASSGRLAVFDLLTRKRIDAFKAEATAGYGVTLGISVVPGTRRVATVVRAAPLEHTLRVWDWSTGELVQDLRVTSPAEFQSVPQLLCSQDGSRLLLSSRESPHALLVGLQDGTASAELLHRPEIRIWLGMSPDGKWLACTDHNSRAFVVAAASASQKSVLPFWKHGYLVNSAAFSSDGRRVATSSHDRFVMVVDMSDATAPNAAQVNPRLRLEPPANVYFSDFSDSGDELLTVCKDSKVRVWDLKTGQVHGAPISADEDIAGKFRPGHQELLIGDYAGSLNVWDWRARTRCWPGQQLCREPGAFWAYRRYLTASPNGHYAALAGIGELYVCDLSPLDETESISPEDLQLRAEVLSGLRMLDNGTTVSLTPSEWQERVQRFVIKGLGRRLRRAACGGRSPFLSAVAGCRSSRWDKLPACQNCSISGCLRRQAGCLPLSFSTVW